MRTISRALSCSIVMMAPLLLLGCGDGSRGAGDRQPVHPVGGTIMYKGSPVADANVTFFCEEKNMSGYGRTDSQGRFRITTYGANDGAVAGKHVVVVQKVQLTPAAPEPDVEDTAYVPPGYGPEKPAVDPKTLIPAKYGDPKTSDQFVVVTEGDNPDVTIELTD